MDEQGRFIVMLLEQLHARYREVDGLLNSSHELEHALSSSREENERLLEMNGQLRDMLAEAQDELLALQEDPTDEELSDDGPCE